MELTDKRWRDGIADAFSCSVTALLCCCATVLLCGAGLVGCCAGWVVLVNPMSELRQVDLHLRTCSLLGKCQVWLGSARRANTHALEYRMGMPVKRAFVDSIYACASRNPCPLAAGVFWMRLANG